MGCAYITNNSQIKINEVDISGEATNIHKSDLNQILKEYYLNQ
jgi:hypothetical protein